MPDSTITTRKDEDFISTHKTIDEELFAYIADRIVEAYNPKRVILFGSYARGDAGPDSDVDIFVEMESEEKPVERRLKIRRLFFKRWWPMDILVYTPEEIVERKHSPFSIVPTIEQEGRILFER